MDRYRFESQAAMCTGCRQEGLIEFIFVALENDTGNIQNNDDTARQVDAPRGKRKGSGMAGVPIQWGGPLWCGYVREKR